MAFRYFYEFLKDEGPQIVEDVEKKWNDEAEVMQEVCEILNTTNNCK